MPNLYLPAAAMILSGILLTIFCLKKRVYIKENVVYLHMLIAILLDSMLVSAIFVVAYKYFNESVIVLLNRFDYMCLFAWVTGLFLYTYIVIHKKDADFEKRYRRIVIFTLSASVILSIVMWFLDIDLIAIDMIKTTAQGAAVNFSIISCVCFMLISLGLIIFNPRKIKRQVIPVFVGLLISMIIAFLFSINPYLILVSFGLMTVNLVMYFTIENPDVQMLEAVNEAKEKAQRANNAKTEFLSAMSHEIRTPLNAIVGFSECIMDDKSLAEAKEDAKDIRNASGTLLELVNNILDISKIEAGRMEIVNKEYDLTRTASLIAKIVQTRIGEKPIILETDFSSDIPPVLFGDESKIRQIMTNLLTNAVKYTEKGRVDFIITSKNDNDTAIVEITISDTGRGIRQDQIKHLFDKFKRLDEDLNSSIEGTGLGLSITKNLVEMMNGSINVQSVYGRGSTFTVTVPQTIRPHASVAAPTSDLPVLSYPDRKVLVVDDNALNLKVATRMLELFDIHADTANSGSRCLELCSATTYDLILMDDMMPGMNGAETMEKLRELPGFSAPIVVLTANALEGMKEKYCASGFSDYLSKPIIKNDLGKILQLFLS